MNPTDLQIFNHAISLAKFGFTSESHSVLLKLLQNNPRDVSLLLWLAFTSSDLMYARHTIELATSIEPSNPNIHSARGWLEQQEQKHRAQREKTPTAPLHKSQVVPVVSTEVVPVVKVEVANFFNSGISLVPTQQPQEETEIAFRQTSWGMSKTKVQKIENAEYVKEIVDGDYDLLFYTGKVSGLNSIILYTFLKGCLIRAKYHITEEHSNKFYHITDFHKLKDNLTKKYGMPLSDTQTWHNELYRHSVEDWGLAVCIGDLNFLTIWETKSSEIDLCLGGDNYEVTLVIEYESKRLKYMEEEYTRKKVLDEL